MILLKLAWRSLLNRKITAILTVLSIMLSIAMLVGVEKVRAGVKDGFLNTISGTDLIVGARTGDIQLLLYSVFRIGDATNNMSWETVEDIKRRPEVAWVVPISLGDSHRGFRVMGTSKAYFKRYKYRRTNGLNFAEGKAFDDLFDVVLGHSVAEKLGYKLNDQIIVSHGTGRVSFGNDHDDKPFRVSGILARTGTPVDRTLHVSIEAIEAIHIGWENGTAPKKGDGPTAGEVRNLSLQPKSTTALMVGLRSRIMTFSLQRWVNTYRQEAVTAVLPGVAFAKLWNMLGNIELALRLVSAMVVFTAFLGMLITVLSSLNERRREMAILRAVGAKTWHIFALMVTEALTLVFVGAVMGLLVVALILLIGREPIEQWSNLDLNLTLVTGQDLKLLLSALAGGLIAAIVPALRACSLSLSDGLTIRV